MNADETLIHRNNLKRAWALAGPEKWTDEQYEQLRASSFEEWGCDWMREIYK